MRKRHKSQYSDPAVEWTVNQIKDKAPTETSHKQLVSGTVSEHHTKLKLRTVPITWGIPMDELMYSKFFTNILHLNMMPWDSVITTESTYLPDARNYIHEIFVTQYKTSHLFMLDSDVLPPPFVVEKLLDHNLPIVGAFYRKKESFTFKDLSGNEHVTARPVVYDWSQEKDGKFWFASRIDPGVGLEKVAGIGAGCLLMRRDVAIKLGERPYNMNSAGEDLTLCKKLMDLEIPLYVDWDLPCAHVGVSYI